MLSASLLHESMETRSKSWLTPGYARAKIIWSCPEQTFPLCKLSRLMDRNDPHASDISYKSETGGEEHVSGSCLSVNRVWVYLNNHGTEFLGPNQTNNSFGTQSKLKFVNSSFEFADWLEKHSTSFQPWACRDRAICACGSLFRYFRSKLCLFSDISVANYVSFQIFP